jgi:hypothetical protein
MQPLPPAAQSSEFSTAAAAFRSAAAAPTDPASPGLLNSAADAVQRGIPSLRMTTDRDTGGPIADSLNSAADGARKLATTLTSTPQSALSSVTSTISGWADAAESAISALNNASW